MSYEIDIPEELRPTIIEYITNSRKSMRWNELHLVWLMTVFYRYVEPLNQGGRFKTVAEKVKTKMRCGNCRETMFDYFDIKIDEWQAQAE